MHTCTRWILVLAFSAMAWAQPGQRSFLEVLQPVQSGPRTNPGVTPALVWSEQVGMVGASSLILLFDRLELGGPDDRILITSLLDGDVQVLDHFGIKTWATRSAHFRGPVVNVALELGPGSSGEVTIRGAVGQVSPESPENLCGGTDDRVPSTEVRTCRLVTPVSGGFVSFCTGWLISSTSTILSAGHCAFGAGGFTSGTVAEFNVPASDSSGFIVPPPVVDQYPFDHSSRQFADTGVGNDWAVARLHPNSTGQTAFDRQGAFFALATSMPLFVPGFGPTVRLTGFGDDTQNTRAFTNQTSTGALVAIVGDTVTHHVDSEGGNSGGPLILVSSGQAIAVHTNGGCDIPVVGFNSGTSILNGGLQNAIDDVVGCAALTLADGNSSLISCTDTIFDLDPVDGRWNVVGITSTSDWDLRIDGIGSFSINGTCDFLLANDNLGGSLPPRSGRMNRFSGSANARATFDVADDLTVGVPMTTTWSSTSVVRAFEVTLTNGQPYEIAVNGSTELGWRLYPPGSSNAWRARSSSATTSGSAGGAVANFVASASGVHCLVVFKDDGVASVSPTQLSIALCNGVAPIVLSAGTEQTVTAACSEFVTVVTAGEWNATAVSSPVTSDWNLYLGTAQSVLSPGTTDFVLANGNLGAIAPLSGVVDRASGSGSGTLVAVPSTTLSVGVQFDATLTAGEIVDLYEFNASTAGVYTVHVTGGGNDPDLFWRLFAPGSSARWIRRSDSIDSGSVGSGVVSSLSLGVGVHAIAVYRNNGPTTQSISYGMNVCFGAPHVVLGGQGQGTTISPACATFELTPELGEWNAVGLASDSNWDLAIGDAESERTTAVEFLVSNGRLGAPAGDGIAIIEVGIDAARLQHAITSGLTLGSTTATSLSNTTVLRIHEFEIVTPGSYDLVTTGTGLEFGIFDPGTSGAWRPAVSALQSGALGGTVTRTLAAGFHSVVVHRTTSVGTTLSYSIRVEPTPHPVPSLSSISPATRTAGTSSFVLTANGSGFVANSSIRLNGVGLSTTLVSSTQLQATVSAASTALPGTISVTVFPPAPGGVSGAGQTLTVSNPGPGLNTMSPNAALVGSSGVTLTLTGTSFVASSVVRWGGVNLPTTFNSATQLTSTVSASLLSTAGSVSVVVFNPAPGGGQSNGLNFVVNNPAPVLSAISPSSRNAATPAFTCTATASNFVDGSRFRCNGANLATTFVSSTQLTATVPAANVALAGSASVTVFSAAPGGGTSAARTFNINNPVPTLGSVNPNPIQVGAGSVNFTVTGTGFVSNGLASVSIVRVNGTNLTTTLLTPTILAATLPASFTQSATVLSVTVFNPSPVGGTSASFPLTIANPVPTMTSVAPSAILSGSPLANLLITGSGFVPSTLVTLDGQGLPTSFVSGTELNATLPASLLVTPRIANLVAFNAGPGGGTSAPRPLSILGPILNSITPNLIPVQTPTSPNVPIIVSGSNLGPQSVVYANGDPLPTTFINALTLSCSITPAIEQTLKRGAVAIHIANSDQAVSRGLALEIGGGENEGLIRRHPLNPAPGQAYSAVTEGGVPNALFSLFVDTENPGPLFPFVDGTMNQVLATSPIAGSSGLGWIPLVDGFGLLSPASGATLDAQGGFVLPGFVRPDPAVGISITVQGVYLDATAPYGFRLTWARFPDRL